MNKFSDKNIFIMGIRRSGNHAITSWLIPQLESEYLRYFNDHYYDTLSNNKKGRTFNNTFLREGRVFTYEIIDKKTTRLENLNQETHYSVFGLENQNIEMFYSNYNNWENNINVKIKDNFDNNLSKDNKYVAIIRNPWNNMASEIQWHYNGKNYNVPKHILIKLWKQYYDYFINNNNENLVFIIYDKWFIDIEYRKEISKKLGLVFNDENLNLIHHTGSGSSFTKQMYNGYAQQMKVLNRYDETKNYPDMQMFINSDDGKELKERWNNLCDLERIKKLKIK